MAAESVEEKHPRPRCFSPPEAGFRHDKQACVWEVYLRINHIARRGTAHHAPACLAKISSSGALGA
jgi:hypothetical protein